MPTFFFSDCTLKKYQFSLKIQKYKKNPSELYVIHHVFLVTVKRSVQVLRLQTHMNCVTCNCIRRGCVISLSLKLIHSPGGIVNENTQSGPQNEIHVHNAWMN